jgi:DNA invertase Pin-like site-specific DNA recombinase
VTDYGYARVSTRAAKGRKAQHVDNQVETLKVKGIHPEHIFADDGVSGTKASRPEWDRLLATVKAGDTITAVSLTRIGRSMVNVVSIVNDLGSRGVGIRFVDQPELDTTSIHGKLILAIMAALAEYEAELTRSRVRDGLEAARERHGGKLPPRGPSFTTAQRAKAEKLLETTDFSASEVARMVGVSRATLYRHVDVYGIRGS